MKSSRPLRVLLVGFSATAAGFGGRFIQDATEEGFDVECVALGGNHPYDLMFFMDYILGKRGRFDIVLLEINTSGFRRWATTADHIVPWVVLTHKIRAARARPIFVNLPRADFIPKEDAFTNAIAPILSDLGAPVIALDEMAYERLGTSYMHEQFFKPDGTGAHPNLSEVEWLVGTTIDQLKQILKSPDHGKHIRKIASATSCVPFTQLFPAAPTHAFSRNGFSLSHLEINASETFENSGVDYHVCGLSMLCHPRAGTISLTLNDDVLSIPCFDQWGYYERVLCRMFDLRHVHSIKVYQNTEIPEVALLKGEANLESRIGRLGLMMTSQMPPNDLKAAVSDVHNLNELA